MGMCLFHHYKRNTKLQVRDPIDYDFNLDLGQMYGKRKIDVLMFGYIHPMVNHSKNFVDPHTGAHTKTIEGV